MADLKDKHVNRYLTNFAVKYRSEDNVADWIAPAFRVTRPSDKYLAYTKSVFRIYDNRLARREPVKEIRRDAEDEVYACKEYALGDFIYTRDLKNIDNGIRLKEESIEQVKDSQIISREKRISDIATSQAIITQNVDIGADWATAAGTPVADFLTGMATIYNATCGRKANSASVPYTVALAAIQTTEWKSYFQYTWGLKPSGNGLFDLLLGLRHIGIEARIAGAFGGTTYEGTGSDPEAEVLWGENTLLFYREPRPTTRSLTFMHSPFVEKDMVRQFYKEEERGWKYTLTEDIDELLVSAPSAYLMYNCI